MIRIGTLHNNTRTILLVEDEAIIAMNQAKTVRGFGYEVIIAYSGDEAVTFTTGDTGIDLVLMDIDLGEGIDGTEAAQRILAKRRIPIVFLTSHMGKEYVDRVKEITRYGYVIKNSGDFVLQSSIEMAFHLFEAHENLRLQYDISRALNSTTKLEQGLHDILKVALQFESIDCGGIYMANPDKRRAELIAHQGLSQKFVECFSHIDYDSTDGKIALNGVVTFISYTDLCSKDDAIVKSEGLRSIACIPVMSQGKLVAVLNLASHSVDSISHYTRIAIETLASNIGNALQRVRMNNDLMKSNEKYRHITESMSDFLTEIDPRGLIRYISPSHRRLVQDDPEELIGTSIFNKVHPQDLERVAAEYNEAVRTKKDREVEYRYLHGNGHYVWLRTSGHPVYDDAGTFAGAVLTSSDITERKKSEEELHITEARYRLLFENSPDGILIIDPFTARILEFNETAHRQLGYTRDEFSKLSIFDLEASESPEDVRSRIAHVIKEGHDDFKTLQRSRDGEIRNVHVTAQYTDIMGQGLYHCIWRDITDRKRAEEALQESEAKYRQIFTHAPAGIYEVDFIKQRFTRVNPLICEYTGYTEDELLSMNPLDILIEESKQDFIVRLKKMLDGEAIPANVEYRIKNKDGRTMWVEINNVFFSENGKITAAAVVAHDITERKISEEKIQKLLTEKELLLREVHHRIKNNMNSMMSLLTLQAGEMKEQESVAALNDARNRLHSMDLLYDKLYKADNLKEMSLKEYLPSLVDQIVSNFPNAGMVTVNKKIDDFIISVKALSSLSS